MFGETNNRGIGVSPQSPPPIAVVTLAPQSITHASSQALRNILFREYGIASNIPVITPGALGGDGKRLDRLICIGDAATDKVILEQRKKALCMPVIIHASTPPPLSTYCSFCYPSI